jgi:hypothetical protein
MLKKLITNICKKEEHKPVPILILNTLATILSHFHDFLSISQLEKMNSFQIPDENLTFDVVSQT